MKLHIIAIITIALCGCATPPDNARPVDFSQLKSEMRRTNIADGIDADEAYGLAVLYRHAYASCGLTGAVTDDGENWSIEVRLGMPESLVSPIIINKNTGAISWKHGQTIDNWADFLGKE